MGCCGLFLDNSVVYYWCFIMKLNLMDDDDDRYSKTLLITNVDGVELLFLLLLVNSFGCLYQLFV